MNIPPAILDLDVTPEDGHRVHVWLPLFLFWPMFLVFGVLALVFAVIADVVLFLLGRRYHRCTRLMVGLYEALCQTRGTVLRFNDSKAAVNVTVQ